MFLYNLRGKILSHKIEKISGVRPEINPLSARSKYSFDYVAGIPIEKIQKLDSEIVDRCIEIALGHKLEVKEEPSYKPVNYAEVEKNLKEYCGL